MRAIIIDDKDAKALVKQLELAKLQAPHGTNLATLDGRHTVEQLADELHRKFHYVVVRWLQEQGASVT